MGVRHSHTAAGTNDATKEVSVDRWNADHVVDGALQLGGLSSDPGSPANGEIWLNTTTGEIKARTGGVTMPFGPDSAPQRVYYFNDFFTSSADNFGNVNQSGTGAAATVVVWPWGGSPVGCGFLRLALGTTATGRATWWSPLGAVQVYLTQGVIKVRARGGLLTLSDGTNRYLQYIGITNAHSAEPSQGCYFRYSDNLSSGNWEAVTAKSGTTATDTGVAADTNGNHTFEIIVNAAGTSVEFYIDETLVATNTTNIPNATDALGILVGARKTLGTTATTASAWDYYSLDMRFPSRT
jgi:hypothetical protein